MRERERPVLVIPQTKQNLVASRRRHSLRIKIATFTGKTLYRTQILYNREL